MNRAVCGIYVWQWIVGLMVFVGLNLMFTVPGLIQAYQQQHQQYSVTSCSVVLP